MTTSTVTRRPLRILIIDNFDSFTHNLSAIFTKLLGIPPLVVYNTIPVHVFEQLLPTLDAIVISPGPGHPAEAADVGICSHVLQSQYVSIPVLGICLGLQCLVQLNDGEVIHASKPMHGELDQIIHNQTGLFKNIPSPFNAIRYNSLIAKRMEHSDLQITAWNGEDEIMGVDLPSRGFYSVQFHPESVCTEHGTMLFCNFIEIVYDHGSFNPDRPIKEIEIDEEYRSSQWSFNSSIHPIPENIPNAATVDSQPAKSSIKILTHGLPYKPSDQVFAALFSTSKSKWWLDSSRITERSRFSYMGDGEGPLSMVVSYNVNTRSLRIGRNNSTLEMSQLDAPTTFLEVLDQIASKFEHRENSSTLGVACGKFLGGWVGWYGYEMRVEGQPDLSSDGQTWVDRKNVNIVSEINGSVKPVNGECEPESKVNLNQSDEDAQNEHSSPNFLPSSSFVFADRWLVFDHVENRCIAFSLYDSSSAPDLSQASSLQWFEDVKSKLLLLQDNDIIVQPTITTVSSIKKAHVHWRYDELTYKNLIQRCLHAIRDGESYELCLTNHLFSDVVVDPLLFYRHLRRINPAPFASYLAFDPAVIFDPDSPYQWLSVLCSSPERFLHIDESGNAECKPIKGTVPRGKTPAEDEELRLGLQNSTKDRAENLMIVDLIRSDLARVCIPSSVNVPSLFAIESYPTLHTMVTTVTAELPKSTATSPHTQSSKLFHSMFPPGSMTGAPKLRSCAILKALEQKSRGIYSGCLGYLSLNGALDFNVVIRTAVCTNRGVSVGAGGAIVIHSDPKSEWEEAQLKTRAIVQALNLIISIS